MRPLPRPRPRWRLRRPSRVALLAAAASVATFVFVQTAATASESTRARWGPTVQAQVAVIDLDAGHRLTPDDVHLVAVPSSLVPDDATASEPAGRVVRTPIGAGEIVVERRLSGPGAPGLGSMLGPDQRGVSVPASGLEPPLGVGDQVDVLATLDPSAGAGEETVLLVERVMVVATNENGVTLAVERSDVPTLTHALVTTTVTLVLVG